MIMKIIIGNKIKKYVEEKNNDIININCLHKIHAIINGIRSCNYSWNNCI